MITSSQNPKIKRIRGLLENRKERQQEKVFIIEGVRLAEEALKSGSQPELVLYSAELSIRGRNLVDQFLEMGCLIEEVDAGVLRSLSDTETPQGIISVFSFPERSLSQLIVRYPSLYLVLDQVRDPGNAGTLLRSAAAVGADGVISLKGTVDLTNSKVLRSSMGGIFRMPWLEGVAPEEMVDWSKAQGISLLYLEPRGGQYFHQADYNRSIALVVGSEAQGLSPELLQCGGESITVPMPGGSESLNVAMAATLVLFQVMIGRGL
jgi:TrmH family RNA methyltransferase